MLFLSPYFFSLLFHAIPQIHFFSFCSSFLRNSVRLRSTTSHGCFDCTKLCSDVRKWRPRLIKGMWASKSWSLMLWFIPMNLHPCSERSKRGMRRVSTMTVKSAIKLLASANKVPNRTWSPTPCSPQTITRLCAELFGSQAGRVVFKSPIV